MERGGGVGTGEDGGGNAASGEAGGEAGGEWSQVVADAPLAAMVGYATALRSMTAGQGAFSMSFAEYRAMDPFTAKQVLAESQF